VTTFFGITSQDLALTACHLVMAAMFGVCSLVCFFMAKRSYPKTDRRWVDGWTGYVTTPWAKWRTGGIATGILAISILAIVTVFILSHAVPHLLWG
jgi:hypothetical protein